MVRKEEEGRGGERWEWGRGEKGQVDIFSSFFLELFNFAF